MGIKNDDRERKVASRIMLVTGGSGGLGLAVIRALLGRGDGVWALWHTPDGEDRLRTTFPDEPALRLVAGDATDAEAMADVVDRIEREDGRLDGVCNLVGGFTMAPLAETSDAAWDGMMTLNARSTFITTRAALPLLLASPGGRIVNVAAAPAVRHGGKRMSAYTASKGAVVALTHALAAEVGPESVTVNAIAPTTIDTPANREAMPKADRSGWVTPDEIASLIVWLTSDEARVVTGNVILAGR